MDNSKNSSDEFNNKVQTLLKQLSPEKRKELFTLLEKAAPDKRNEMLALLVERYEKMNETKDKTVDLKPINSIPKQQSMSQPSQSANCAKNINSNRNTNAIHRTNVANKPINQDTRVKREQDQRIENNIKIEKKKIENRKKIENKKNKEIEQRKHPNKTNWLLRVFLIVLLVLTVMLVYSCFNREKMRDLLGIEREIEVTELSDVSNSVGVSDVTSATDVATEVTTTVSEASQTTPAPTVVPDVVLAADAPNLTGLVVVIDPGHQEVGNDETEPCASWLSMEKPKCTVGSTGISTGIHEYELTLNYSLMLSDYLTKCGATVVLTRETNDVDISNSQRAQIAIDNGADVYLRIHADGINDTSISGIKIFVPDSGDLVSADSSNADTLGGLLSEATGEEFLGTQSTYVYTGLNYANSVPAFQISLGNLSNSDDETNLVDPDVQISVCEAFSQFCALFV